MTMIQIKQTIGQLKASIDKARAELPKEEFLEYSTAMYICIEMWEKLLKEQE